MATSEVFWSFGTTINWNYLDGVLDARTKSELDDHLAWCHNCYVVCDTTRKTIEIYRDSGTV